MFPRPVVGVVGDAAGLVGFDLVALHDPFDGGTAVHHVVVGGKGDVRQADVGVVLNRALVAPGDEAHLAHGEVPALRARHGHVRAGRPRFIVQVQGRQGAARVAECPEVVGPVHQRQARQHFFEVGREGFPVVRGMEQAIDVVEDVLLRDLGPVLQAAFAEDEVGDAVLADVLLARLVKERALARPLLVVVQREALRAVALQVQIGDAVNHEGAERRSHAARRGDANQAVLVRGSGEEFGQLIDHFIEPAVKVQAQFGERTIATR